MGTALRGSMAGNGRPPLPRPEHTLPQDPALGMAAEPGAPAASLDAPSAAPDHAAGRPASPIAAAGVPHPALLVDAELVERARSDPEAFGVLYERHVRSVFGFALGKLHDPNLAEDITSQTFLQALRALPRYEQRGMPFRGWLLRIAANLIADRFRSPIAEQPFAARRGRGDLGDGDRSPILEIADPAAESDLTSWELAQDFADLIRDLTPEQRTVIQLRFAEALPIAEIAARMSRSEGSVKMLLLRGLQQLRKRMGVERA